MGPDTYVAHLRRDSARLAAVAEGNLGEQVPSCPEWDVARLVWHVGEVQRFWGEVVRHKAQAPVRPEQVQPDDDALLAWFREGVELTATTLEAADPSAPVWTWTSTDDTAAWVQRRMAHETAVHRWDGEAAAGQTTAIDRELAVDGIDEFVDVFLPEADAPADFGRGTIHLHATDGEGEWLLSFDGADVAVTRGHAKGDVAVRGTASDLLLVLWRRIPPADVEVLGDGDVLDHFLAGAAVE
jgi:uncharacterized protein (TIGR03083 family)